ncbi:hypothetical protein [Alkalihalobacillus sp. BA299]|uniref:hypothetical protein n=1 Tax=Alkalihalobacillus sp. BA299 TaxID=2815938 RepID=UPI001ADD4B3B|nr:hypothetical protein [Alkalihalobacillus sp. BA299]
MSKNKVLIEKVKLTRNGMYFEDEDLYTISHCRKCKEDFVLHSHDNPAYDGPRVYEFPDVCDDCL